MSNHRKNKHLAVIAPNEEFLAELNSAMDNGERSYERLSGPDGFGVRAFAIAFYLVKQGKFEKLFHEAQSALKLKGVSF